MDEEQILNILLKESPGKFPARKEEYDLILKYQSGEDSLGNEIIRNYLRFVVKIAKKYKRNGNLLDLIQEGNIGLLEAAGRFKTSLGNSFLSYAEHYVKSKIIAEFKKGYDSMSLDKKISDSEKLTLIEKIIDRKNPPVYDFIEKHDAMEKITKHLDSIDPHYSQILRLLYIEQKNIDQISRIMNLSSSNIREKLPVAKRMLASKIKNDESLIEFIRAYL